MNILGPILGDWKCWKITWIWTEIELWTEIDGELSDAVVLWTDELPISVEKKIYTKYWTKCQTRKYKLYMSSRTKKTYSYLE